VAATVLLRPAVALALTGVMLATGCDSDGYSSPPATPTTSSPGATPTATPTGEQIRLPDDVTLDFDWTPTGDANADAAVQAVIQLERAAVVVIAYGDRGAAPYKRYVIGAARQLFEDAFDANIDAGLGATGTDRFFDFKVEDISAVSARVSFCEDQWDFYATNRETGQIYRTTPDPRGGYRITETLRKSASWQVETRVLQEGVARCRLDH